MWKSCEIVSIIQNLKGEIMDDEFLLCKDYLARFGIQLNYNSINYILTTATKQMRVGFLSLVIEKGLALYKIQKLEDSLLRESDFRKRRKISGKIYYLSRELDYIVI